MTYDPRDVPNGLLVSVSDMEASPTARMVRELDSATDALMNGCEHDGLSGEALKGYARGLCRALTYVSCYKMEDVRSQIMIRHARREESSGQPGDQMGRAVRRKRRH